MKTSSRVRESRTYVHRRCNGETTISGPDFEQLTNPFVLTTGTLCCACGKVVRVRDVSWVDTGESVGAYRRRVRAAAPLHVKLLAWLVVPIVVGVIGYLVGRLFPGAGNKNAIVGAITGVLVYLGVFMPFFTRLVLKIDYRSVD
jgi:hypothetical protein